MRRRHESTGCEQARQWISLRLDGELSEFERAALERHLDRCADCSAFAVELAGIAQLLRSAPLADVEVHVAQPRTPARRVLAPARPAWLAAALSAAAVALFLLIGSSGPAHSTRDALQFRSAGEESRYLSIQQRRIEPPVPSTVVTPPRMNPRGLL